MIRKNFKGRCRKWKLEKCKNVMRAYSDIQEVYAEQLAVDDSVKEIRCNVMMTGLEEGEYISDLRLMLNHMPHQFLHGEESKQGQI